MYIPEQLLLVLGLSMDGFAAAVCMGIAAGRHRKTVPITVLVSGCHVGMVVLGCLLGAGFRRWMEALYPWLAASLLLALGGNMLRTAGEEDTLPRQMAMGHMALLAFATSIDAFTVGVAFALMEVSALRAGWMVAAVMGALSLAGALLGSRVGARHRKRARQLGGVILCILGLKLLWGALGMLSF